MDINKLISITNEYMSEDENIIRNAFLYADVHHKGQKRESNEDYIIHPLYVAHILAKYKADKDVICAALLHDTLEDTSANRIEIQELFGSEVLKLVEGVTKINEMFFPNRKEENLANTRKILCSIPSDVRIILIKFADRLHNMRTLQYKKRDKQIENAQETLELYVPLADALGLYKIKIELEDLSFKYLASEKYQFVRDMRSNYIQESKSDINEMLLKINHLISSRHVPYQIKIRIKNIYGTYKRLNEGHSIDDIHDLIAVQIMTDTIDQCYLIFGDVHSLYRPVPQKVRDYICNPKTNMYRSLHTTVFAPNDKLMQAQIRTFDMELMNKYGLASYYQSGNGNVNDLMKESLYSNYPFITSLTLIDNECPDNEEFISQVKNEILSSKIYVYTTNGKVVELPFGSTVVDFANRINRDLINRIKTFQVNDAAVEFNYKLKNGDIIRIITNEYDLNNSVMMKKTYKIID